MNREHRINIAQATLATLERGNYPTTAQPTVDISHGLDQAKRNTQTYQLGDVPTANLQRFATPLTVSITHETCCAALERLSCAGAQHLGILNFASAKNPGGGFLNGAQAQEEALARSSGLYPCLLTQMATFYEPNRANSSSLYLDAAICSPGVPFFRNDAGDYWEQPLWATVVTAPAPNAGAVAHNQPHDMPQVLPTLARRAAMVLQLLAASGAHHLILGAWGCGVFRNDPHQVAQTFAALLQPGGAYSHAFESVTFAIAGMKDLTNINAFQQAFATNITTNKHPVESIYFYSTKDTYGDFSNFAPFPIVVDGVPWRTSEHYFQGQKFAGQAAEQQVREAISPMKAAQMGRQLHGLRNDWEAVKDDVMRTALHAKFTQHHSLRTLLLGTKDAVLVEHTKNDSYWADGGDGTGKNRLGILLMELREQLAAER